MSSTPSTSALSHRSPHGAVGALAAGPREGAPALGRSAGPFIASRDLEHAVLHLLAGEGEPLGSGSLLEQLQGLGYAGAGLVVGLPIAFAATRLMESVVFGITTHDAVTFTLLPAIVALTTLMACAIPARRAARVNPAAMMRGD